MSMYITIAGIIGSGKTTLAKDLAQHFEAQERTTFLYMEDPDRNDYLPDYYAGRGHEISFPLQVQMLAQRLDQQMQIRARLAQCPQGLVIEDRSIYEDYYVFCKDQAAQGMLGRLEMENLERLQCAAGFAGRRPDILIFLDTQPEIALERIGKRGRPYETKIDTPWLQRLRAREIEMLSELETIFPPMEIWHLDGARRWQALDQFKERFYNYETSKFLAAG